MHVHACKYDVMMMCEKRLWRSDNSGTCVYVRISLTLCCDVQGVKGTPGVQGDVGPIGQGGQSGAPVGLTLSLLCVWSKLLVLLVSVSPL